MFIDREHLPHKARSGKKNYITCIKYNICVSCVLIGHIFPTVLQILLIQVSATDPEYDTSLTYSLEGQYASMFELTNQQISVSASFDRDYPDGHSDWLVTVAARDSSVNPRLGQSHTLMYI